MGAVTLEHSFRAMLQRLPDVRRWVIAHSGGLDSQVLLHLAVHHLSPEQIHVLHINHHLQPLADDWARFSAAQAANYAVQHQTIDVTPDGTSEESARVARYAAFESVIDEGDCLLQAHHCDDQAETLLYRLLRGTGLRGLGAMPRQRALAGGWLLRPLLSSPRAELEAYARSNALEWIEDPSNRDEAYDRNYLRHAVLPLLAARWPGFAQRWQQAAEQLRATQQVLDEYLDQELETLVGDMGELSVSLIQKHSPERRDHLLLRWFQRAGVVIGQRQLRELVVNVLGARSDGQPELRFGNVMLRRYRDGLFLVSVGSSRREGLGQLMPGSYRLSDGVLTVARCAEGISTLDDVVMVRRQGGERCRPAGRGGSCSVKQCLQEAGIPTWLRADWPLLMVGNEVVSVVGVCVCEGWLSKSGGYASSWRSFALSEQG